MTATVTMADIATIAGVTRQAVTNWRRRPAIALFPDPVMRDGEVDLFERDAVVAWLEQTGRGKNADARVDAPAIAVPEGVTVAAATAVLAVRASVGEDLATLDPSDRNAVAQRVDPQDAFVLSEFRAVAADDTLVGYVDELLAAAFGPSDALDRLYLTRASKGDRGIAAELVEILRQAASACREFLGPDGVAIDFRVDQCARSVADGFDAAAPGCDRATLQHLVVQGLDVANADQPVVRVVSVLGMTDAEALRAVAEVSLDLAERQIAVVFGAASALCDRLTGELYQSRKDTISAGAQGFGGSLVAAFRLPRALWAHAHRQNVGLWVLRGASTPESTVVGDLSAQRVDPAELATDIVGALESTSTRSYKYGRRVPYATAWTRGAVVDPGVGPARAVSAMEASSRRDRAIAATLITRETLPGLDVAISPIGSASPAALRPLGELIDGRVVSVRSGTRILQDHIDSEGSIRVLSADPAAAEAHIDPFVAADHYHSASRTEPGDVIFVTRPAPNAIVDEDGGAIVVSPSRILRIESMAKLRPHTLAIAINTLALGGEWRLWQIPMLPTDEVDSIEEALMAAGRHLAVLRQRHVAAMDLVMNLIRGVSEGSIALAPQDFTKKEG